MHIYVRTCTCKCMYVHVQVALLCCNHKKFAQLYEFQNYTGLGNLHVLNCKNTLAYTWTYLRMYTCIIPVCMYMYIRIYTLLYTHTYRVSESWLLILNTECACIIIVKSMATFVQWLCERVSMQLFCIDFLRIIVNFLLNKIRI